jgi:2-dehydro-3-deoxy-D-arabinonate dehydratase
MSTVRLLRFFLPDKGARLGCQIGQEVSDMSYYVSAISDWLRRSIGRVEEAIEQLENQAERAKEKYPLSHFHHPPDPETPHLLSPVYAQEIWASSFTYQVTGDLLKGVLQQGYTAERPFLYFKSHGRRAVGHLDQVGIRADSTLSIPEAELAVVLNPALEVVGFTIANDMTSLDLRRQNPYYLNQAKMYRASCAVGPSIILKPAQDYPSYNIKMSIQRGQGLVYEGETSTKQITRRLPDLIEYLGRSNDFPDGVVLLTGTGIVPPEEFSLQEGDVVSISIDHIGTLENTVAVV